jgi:hypothetical protein
MTSDITNNDPARWAETPPAGWLEDLLDRMDALRSLDSSTADEIVGYDNPSLEIYPKASLRKLIPLPL